MLSIFKRISIDFLSELIVILVGIAIITISSTFFLIKESNVKSQPDIVFVSWTWAKRNLCMNEDWSLTSKFSITRQNSKPHGLNVKMSNAQKLNSV